jgi:hypothetical protein
MDEPDGTDDRDDAIELLMRKIRETVAAMRESPKRAVRSSSPSSSTPSGARRKRSTRAATQRRSSGWPMPSSTRA